MAKILAPGKHRVSTPISRARVICPRASFVPENLWEEIPRARHLVNDARICGTNFWREMTRASKFSKLPHFQNFAPFSKFCPIFKISPDFQNFARFSKFRPIFKISPDFQNFAQFSKFRPIFKISPNFQNQIKSNQNLRGAAASFLAVAEVEAVAAR